MSFTPLLLSKKLSGLSPEVFPLRPLFRGKGHRLAHLGGGLMQGFLHESNLAPSGGEVKP